MIKSTKYFLSHKLSLILLVLLPFFLITGPFLSDLAISIISTIFLIKCYYNEKLRLYFKNNLIYFFLFFWIYLLINTIITFQNISSLKISFFYIRFIIFIVATWYLLDSNKKIILYLFYSFLFCFCILVFDGFFQFFFKKNIFGYEIIFNRISSFFGKELILGSYLSRLYPIFFAMYIFLFQNKKNIYFYLIIFIFVFIETLIFLSGERSSFFFINLSTFFILIMSKNFKKIRFICMILSLFLIVTLTHFDNTYKHRIIDNTLDQIGFGSSKIFFFSRQHEAHYVAALKIFKDYPVFGVGVKNFRFFCHDKKYNAPWACTTHPHNTYIQLLSETGIIGFSFIFILFIYFLYKCLWHLYYSFKNKYLFTDFEISLLSSILISLWPLIPTGSFFNNWLNIIFAFPCGILLWSLNRKNQKIN